MSRSRCISTCTFYVCPNNSRLELILPKNGAPNCTSPEGSRVPSGDEKLSLSFQFSFGVVLQCSSQDMYGYRRASVEQLAIDLELDVPFDTKLLGADG